MRTRALIAVISSLVIVAFIFGIIAIISTIDQNNTPPITHYNQPEKAPDAVIADSNTIQQQKAVQNNEIIKYIVKSNADTLHVYKISDDGNTQLLQTVDINPNVLPEQDRLELEKGITSESYEKICSLIEDFSS